MENAETTDDVARVAALEACAVMGTPREASFDNIVFTAAQLFRLPMAALTLVDAHRVWVKASVGPLPQEWARPLSFSNVIIASDQITVIEDAYADPRFAALSNASGDLRIRFVAGVPIRGPAGHHIGALCVFDRLSRTISERQRLQLQQLAVEAGELLRLRVPHLDLDLDLDLERTVRAPYDHPKSAFG